MVISSFNSLARLLSPTIFYILLTLFPLSTSCNKAEFKETNYYDNILLKINHIESINSTDTIDCKGTIQPPIVDVNIYLINSKGIVERHLHIVGDRSMAPIPVPIINNGEYYIYSISNAKDKISFQTKDELENGYINIRESDISDGSIQYIYVGKTELLKLNKDQKVMVEANRICSRIRIKMDLSQFTGKLFEIKKVNLVNIPKRISLYKPYVENSTINSTFSCSFESFDYDFNTSYNDFYINENMKGELLPFNKYHYNKILTNSLEENMTTYIEIQANYKSKEKYGTIIYRLYPGKNNTTNFDIERGVEYSMIICPIGNGIGSFNWRISCDGLIECIKRIIFEKSIYIISLQGPPSSTKVLINFSTEPKYSIPPPLRWESNAPNIATVSQSGVVSAISKGEATITAYSTDGGDASTECKIYVTD